MDDVSPLTPADCDLRGLEWMPLYGDRLFASDTWLMAAPEARCAAMMLWWASWKQRPAGSLADQDKALAQLAGYGSALKAWLNIKEEAMRGWIKCSDGRLYHPVVCELARDAWDRRIKERERKAAYRSSSKNVPRTSTGTGAGQAQGRDAEEYGDGHVDRTGQDRTGQDRTGQDLKEKKESAPHPLIEAMEIWNRICGHLLAGVQKATDQRKRSFLLRFKSDFDSDFAQWNGFCETIAASDFLTGGGREGWKADFDWALEPKHVTKILEGGFSNISRNKRPATGSLWPDLLGRTDNDDGVGPTFEGEIVQ